MIDGMARKLWIEYPGALYPVINRGNYRRGWLFELEKAHQKVWDVFTRWLPPLRPAGLPAG